MITFILGDIFIKDIYVYIERDIPGVIRHKVGIYLQSFTNSKDVVTKILLRFRIVTS
jgi:hypothetical protein